MKNPLYTCIPRWIIRVVETKKCYKCSAKVSKKHICAIGIRPLVDDKNTVYVEHACPNCSTRTITSFAREKAETVEDLCYMLLEQIHARRRMQKSKEIGSRYSSDQIQDKEVDSLVDFMNKSETYEEFLKYIGSEVIPDEEQE
jgi:hypothetical protein